MIDPFDIDVTKFGGTVIAADNRAGLHYLRVRIWPAPDGMSYIPCADIAALYETMRRAPTDVQAIGVSLVHEEKPK